MFTAFDGLFKSNANAIQKQKFNIAVPIPTSPAVSSKCGPNAKEIRHLNKWSILNQLKAIGLIRDLPAKSSNGYRMLIKIRCNYFNSLLY